MVNCKELLKKVSALLGGKSMAGLLLKEAIITNGEGTEAKDIMFWQCIVAADDGTCYKFYMDKNPEIRITKPTVTHFTGAKVFCDYKVDIEEAIRVLNKFDCGNTFVAINLGSPLTLSSQTNSGGPYWRFKLTFGNEFIVDANDGEGGCHKLQEILNKR